MENLDRRLAADARVLGQIHRAHPALAEELGDAVVADGLTNHPSNVTQEGSEGQAVANGLVDVGTQPQLDVYGLLQ